MTEMTLNEKASYIKGLVEGMELDTAKGQGKVIAALLDLVSDMAVTIEELEEEIDTLYDYCEELDEDLGEVETVLVDDDCDCDCCCDDEDCDCCCEDDDEYYEIECPSCGDTVYLDASVDPEELVCPACGEKFECLVSEEDLEALDAE